VAAAAIDPVRLRAVSITLSVLSRKSSRRAIIVEDEGAAGGLSSMAAAARLVG